MPRQINVLWLLTFSTPALPAQAPPTPASLPRSSFLWTQEQREVGFAHWDEVFQAGLRDFARFGQFVLDGGRIDGRSIVPDGFLEEATRRQSETTYAGRGYGYQWWTFEDGSVNAIGIHGQLIHIDRSRRLVVVTSSAWPEATNPDRSAERLRMLAVIAEAIDKEKRP